MKYTWHTHWSSGGLIEGTFWLKQAMGDFMRFFHIKRVVEKGTWRHNISYHQKTSQCDSCILIIEWQNWVVYTKLPFVWDVFLCKSEANEIIYNKIVSRIRTIWKITHHLREMLSARLWQSNCQNGFDWNLYSTTISHDASAFVLMHQHLIRNVYNWIQVASLEIWNHNVPCCVITFPNKIAISICKPSYLHIFTIELAIFKHSWTISWVHCCESHFISG